MVKNLNTSDVSFSIDTKKLKFKQPEKVKLQGSEIEMYRLLFGDGIQEPVKVTESLRKYLRIFIGKGFLEKDFYRFVRLCNECIVNEFDSVKKDGFNVVNNDGDVSLICAKTQPEWSVVCTINKETIEEFYKQKSFIGNNSFGQLGIPNTNSTVSYSSTSSTPVKVSWTVTTGAFNTKNP